MSQQSINDLKSQLRSRIKSGRISGHDCGHSHSQLLIDLVWELRVKTLACYLSFGDEPSTNVFLRHCQLDPNLELFVPRVSGEDLEWVEFNDDQVKHALGMNEPVGEAVELTAVDLVVIPALAIDKNGDRLGRGRGYYDRALSKLDASNIVALVHDDEFLGDVPTEPHDYKVGMVCTCSEIIFIDR